MQSSRQFDSTILSTGAVSPPIMQLSTLFLALVGVGLASPLVQRDYETDDYGNVETLTTYTTVTTCPVTSTYTDEGT